MIFYFETPRSWREDNKVKNLKKCFSFWRSRSKSTEGSGRTPDVDISLEAEGPGSSLATTTIPDMMDLVSVGSSFNRTGSDILLPPLLPESRSLVHMRKLKSLDKVPAKVCIQPC